MGRFSGEAIRRMRVLLHSCQPCTASGVACAAPLECFTLTGTAATIVVGGGGIIIIIIINTSVGCVSLGKVSTDHRHRQDVQRLYMIWMVDLMVLRSPVGIISKSIQQSFLSFLSSTGTKPWHVFRLTLFHSTHTHKKGQEAVVEKCSLPAAGSQTVMCVCSSRRAAKQTRARFLVPIRKLA